LIKANPVKSIFFKNPKLKQALVVALVFLVSESILFFFHEVWRDELQSWALTLNSHSLSELFFNTRYEGHPKLWYMILFALQKFTDNVLYMRLLHLIIASSTVFVFCFYSPLSLSKNILFCFGYFFAYEYSIISRNYAIEMLLLFLSMGIYLKNPQRSIIPVSILIFLILQANAFAVILGLSFFGYIFLSMKRSELLKRKSMIAGCIVLTGLAVFLVTTVPPAGAGFINGWDTRPSLSHLLRVGSNIFRSYFPFPRLIPQFWDTNFTDTVSNSIIPQACLAVLILAVCTVIFYKNKKVLLFFYAGTLGILVFTYTKYIGYMRHHGHFYILFILCCWLYFSNEKKLKRTDSIRGLPDYFITFVLVIQISSTCIAAFYDIKFPFSNAEAAEKFIRDNAYDKMIIAGDADAPVSSIACLMNKNFYYCNGQRWGTGLVWDTGRKEIPDTTFFTETIKLADYFKSDFLLVLSYRPAYKPASWYFLKNFEGAMVGDENYFIYLVKYLKPVKIKL